MKKSQDRVSSFSDQKVLIHIFAALGKKLRAVKTPRETVDAILSLADELFGWDSCFITSYSEQEDITREIIIMDNIDGQRKEIPPSYLVSPPGVMFRRVMSDGPQLILRKPDLSLDEDLIPFGNTPRRSASLMFVPMRRGEECIGMLSIQSYRENAYTGEDFLLLQVLADYCGETLKRTVAETRLQDMNGDYRLLQKVVISDHLEHPEAFSGIIARNPTMKSIFQYVEAIAQTAKPVLITGETGVGKELIARIIHDLSRRKGRFVSINIAGLDDDVFSDTLFGHYKGAFTGADRSRAGLIESASGGTLFLDEIGDLSLVSQIKLLRLLQEGEYFPLGADKPKRSDARILVATNQDPGKLLISGRFRRDFFYRIKTHHVHIPPLRNRLDDLALLVSHFLEKASGSLGRPKPNLPGQIMTFFRNYSFPGNIRELESIIFDMVSHHRAGRISMKGLKQYLHPRETAEESDDEIAEAPEELEILFPANLPTIRQTTGALIEEALKRAEGNQALAAAFLGISPPALCRRLKRRRKKNKGMKSD